jgi:hypothetical protein
MAIDASVAAVTVKVELPATEPQVLATAQVAVIVAVPGLTPAPVPPWLTVAIVVSDDDHATSDVRFWVELSVNFPVALNVCEVPAATLGNAGVTAIETRVAAVTVTVALAVCPWKLAMMVATPAAVVATLPVAAPTVATAALDELHDARAVKSACVLSL